MTREEAIRMIERIKDRINWEVVDSQKKMHALNMAIRSLEAWRKVKAEIEETKKRLLCTEDEETGLERALIIIGNHLAEVSE